MQESLGEPFRELTGGVERGELRIAAHAHTIDEDLGHRAPPGLCHHLFAPRRIDRQIAQPIDLARRRGAIGAAAPGSIVIDSSTNTPAMAIRASTPVASSQRLSGGRGREDILLRMSFQNRSMPESIGP